MTIYDSQWSHESHTLDPTHLHLQFIHRQPPTGFIFLVMAVLTKFPTSFNELSSSHKQNQFQFKIQVVINNKQK